ncbi:capsular exopolysaccharide family [Limimonas halophila]|uniref:non-specific protein-tyrosine kinase n=1 Tax=Limimonas halophila TaxID=1082479 RepID=A0A1G7NLK1_9PROT|nr:polysaccharide biosynthesis tyrosine autokinase [Limimonas halophila]SDF74846.1 capsular exopolysaccharide family [Limimonas halophila]
MNDDRDLPLPSPDRRGYPSTRLQGPSQPETETGDIDLRAIFQTLWRRKFYILIPVIIAAGLSAYVASQMQPTYKAFADILIDPREKQVVSFEDVVGEMSGDAATITTEMAVITSRKLGHQVVDQLNLAENPNFSGKSFSQNLVNSTGLKEVFTAGVTAWNELVGEGHGLAIANAAQEAPAADETEKPTHSDLVDSLIKSLEVSQVAGSSFSEGHSRVIRVSAEATSPELAKRIANTTTEIYLEEQLASKREAATRAQDWLQQRVEEYRKKVEKAEREVAEYRREAGLIEADERTVTGEHLGQLNNKLAEVRTQIAEKQAELQEIEQRYGNRGLDGAIEVISSDLIGELRSQEASLKRRLAELSTEYGSKHPKMVNLRAELKDTQERIHEEVKNRLAALRNDVNVLKARERSLTEQLQTVEGDTAGLNSKQVELRALEREAEANRTIFKTFLSRLKETSARQSLQQPDARVISRADEPSDPSGPSGKLLVVGASGLTFAFACAFVLLAEQFDTTVRSPEQVENAMGVTTLSLVPKLPRLARMSLDPVFYCTRYPRSTFSEAVRNIYAAAVLLDRENPPRTLVFTSCAPGDGKSTLSASVARLLASYGYKVLLVDADLRKPRQHGVFGFHSRPGLTELLRGDVSPAACVQTEEASGLDVITAGATAEREPGLFTMKRTQPLMELFKEHYEIVILDCPPVSGLCDTRVVSALADKTVLVAKWGETRREVIRNNLVRLAETGGDIAGIVLNMVDLRKYGQYDYADSVGYDRRLITGDRSRV